MTQQNKTDWEIRFMNKFRPFEGDLVYDEQAEVYTDIKDFIRTLLAEQREEMAKEIQKTLKNVETMGEGEFRSPKQCRCIGGEGACEACLDFEYNLGIEKALQIIK